MAQRNDVYVLVSSVTAWRIIVTCATDTAGVDTTVNTITRFLLVMILYPEVQQKAQAELDRVVGTDRLPTIEECVLNPHRILAHSSSWRCLQQGKPAIP